MTFPHEPASVTGLVASGAPEGETPCPQGHVHSRRYCIVPGVAGIAGRVGLGERGQSLDDLV